MILIDNVERFMGILREKEIIDRGNLIEEEWEKGIFNIREDIQKEEFLEKIEKLIEKFGGNFYIRYFAPDMDICWKFGIGFIDNIPVKDRDIDVLKFSKIQDSRVKACIRDGFYRFVELV